MKKTRKRNRMFVEWYEKTGCGYQNLIGKTEEEKLECAFVEGMKVVLTCEKFYQKKHERNAFQKGKIKWKKNQ